MNDADDVAGAAPESGAPDSYPDPYAPVPVPASTDPQEMNAADDALFDTIYGQHLQGQQPPHLDGQNITAGENDEDDALFHDDEAQEETPMVEEEPPAEEEPPLAEEEPPPAEEEPPPYARPEPSGSYGAEPRRRLSKRKDATKRLAVWAPESFRGLERRVRFQTETDETPPATTPTTTTAPTSTTNDLSTGASSSSSSSLNPGRDRRSNIQTAQSPPKLRKTSGGVREAYTVTLDTSYLGSGDPAKASMGLREINLVGNARDNEIKFSELSPKDKLSMLEAMKREWQNWTECKATKYVSEHDFAEVRKQQPSLRVVGTRWVLTRKTPSGALKARLVEAQGCQEDRNTMRTDAPTGT